MKESTPPSNVVGGGGSRGGGADSDGSGAHDLKVNHANSTPLLLFFLKNYRNIGRRQEQGKSLAQVEGTIYVAAIGEANHVHTKSTLVQVPLALRKRVNTTKHVGTPLSHKESGEVERP